MMHVMINNDILIRLRYALNITDLKLVEIFALAGKPMTVEEIRPYFLREDEKAYLECDGPTMGAGVHRRVSLSPVPPLWRRSPPVKSAAEDHFP